MKVEIIVNGAKYEVDATPLDPVAKAQAYLQAVSALSLSTNNAAAAVAAQVAEETANVKVMLQERNTLLAVDPSVTPSMQPVIDSAASQFTTNVATLK